MRRTASLWAAIALLVLGAGAPANAASGPQLVKDINPSGASNPRDLTTVGDRVFFAAYDQLHGTELWVSDGTSAGTKLVKNIRPRAKGSYPENLTNVNGTLFFSAIDGAHGRELWKSDGTKAGTVMVKDLVPQCGGGYGCTGGLLISEPPVAIGTRLFFLSEYCCIGTSTLYVSDGTATGTKQVKSNLPISTLGGATAAYAGKFYFAAYTDFDHAKVWVSDGTRAGTLDTGLGVGDDLAFLQVSGANLYFSTIDGSDTGYTIQLYKTNGDVAGTKPLGPENALVNLPIDAALMSSRMYFSDGPGGALWKTNGTSAGTKVISAGPAEFLTVLGGKLYFIRDGALWQSDGTPAGTMAVAAVGMSPVDLTAMGTTLFFAADDGVHGGELWSYTP